MSHPPPRWSGRQGEYREGLYCFRCDAKRPTFTLEREGQPPVIDWVLAIPLAGSNLLWGSWVRYLVGARCCACGWRIVEESERWTANQLRDHLFRAFIYRYLFMLVGLSISWLLLWLLVNLAAIFWFVALPVTLLSAVVFYIGGVHVISLRRLRGIDFDDKRALVEELTRIPTPSNLF